MMLKTSLQITGLCLVAGMAFTSCGSDTPSTPAAFCAQKAVKECEGVAAGCSVDPAACKAARIPVCLAFVAAQGSTTTRPFRSDKVEACLNKTAEIYKKAPIRPADRQAMDEVCALVFSGSKKKKAACESTYECEAPLICDKLVCATKTIATDYCTDPGEVCPGNQHCAGPGPSLSCTANHTTGQPCGGTDGPCLDTLRCSLTTLTCVAKVPQNGTCAVDSDCVGTAPYCDPYFANTCDTGFTPARGVPECAAFGAGAGAGAGGAAGATGGGVGGAAGSADEGAGGAAGAG